MAEHKSTTAKEADAKLPENTTNDTEAEAPEVEAPTAQGEVRHFDGTILKIDKDGNAVMSSTLEPGEQLHEEYRRERAEKAAKNEKKATK